MAKPIDFVNVSLSGVESSPYAEALAGLRANEARYFSNKYGHDFVTLPAAKAKKLVAYVAKVLLERNIVIASTPLEAAEFVVEGTRFTYVFYQELKKIIFLLYKQMIKNKILWKSNYYVMNRERVIIIVIFSYL